MLVIRNKRGQLLMTAQFDQTLQLDETEARKLVEWFQSCPYDIISARVAGVACRPARPVVDLQPLSAEEKENDWLHG